MTSILTQLKTLNPIRKETLSERAVRLADEYAKADRDIRLIDKELNSLETKKGHLNHRRANLGVCLVNTMEQAGLNRLIFPVYTGKVLIVEDGQVIKLEEPGL